MGERYAKGRERGRKERKEEARGSEGAIPLRSKYTVGCWTGLG